ncbi:MAG: hypothetical protein EXS10_02775 [Phycisphaerales bacterium]|nr:hypothetical protein [Phycisphaerales bacterium]
MSIASRQSADPLHGYSQSHLGACPQDASVVWSLCAVRTTMMTKPTSTNITAQASKGSNESSSPSSCTHSEGATAPLAARLPASVLLSAEWRALQSRASRLHIGSR